MVLSVEGSCFNQVNVTGSVSSLLGNSHLILLDLKLSVV